MAFRFDPRGDLPPPLIEPVISTYARPLSDVSRSDIRYINKRLSSISISSKPRVKPCYDWILSSATNVHVAIDQSAFKRYSEFETYVLALSDSRQVHVRGIGTVELKIRRRPDSKEGHVIVLVDVLHIPSWPCNVFSDVYFNPGHDFEHTWNDSGVQFSKRTNSILCAWGYTENFCSLDRLVLGKRHKDARSPMLEDKDREVFSINVVWPRAQRDRWEAFQAEPSDRHLFRVVSEPGIKLVKSPARKAHQVGENQEASAKKMSRRATLSVLDTNIVKRAHSKRNSSVSATLGGKVSSQECE